MEWQCSFVESLFVMFRCVVWLFSVFFFVDSWCLVGLFELKRLQLQLFGWSLCSSFRFHCFVHWLESISSCG